MSGDPGNEPNPVLGPIEEPPFHGMRLRLLGTGYNSGFSLARGITHAYLIAEELAGNPVP